MYKLLAALIILARLVLAAKWAIDGSCDYVGIAKPLNGLSPFLPATGELKEAMKEALTIAESALKVLQDHAEDQHVKDMLGLLLGDGAEYPAKVDAFKRTLEGVLTFEREHAADKPLSQNWQATMTNNDVMIFCSNDRFKPDPERQATARFDVSMRDKAVFSYQITDPVERRHICYAVDYDAGNPQGKVMAFTTDSDHVDFASFKAAPKPKSLGSFKAPSPDIAFSIDFCTWYMHKMSLQPWPRISKERVKQIQQEGYREMAVDFGTPVDGLRNTGLSMLHELTHTNPGGRLDDVSELPPNTPQCYGWKCIQNIKDPKNAENIAMLALALHLWNMGYYVDKDGNLVDK